MTVAHEMENSSLAVSSAEIAIATRDAKLNGVTVEAGEIIGVCEGRLCVSSKEFEEVLSHVLEEMDVANRELVSLYYGQGATESEAQHMASKIEERFPDIEVEVLCGNQAVYQYILGAE